MKHAETFSTQSSHVSVVQWLSRLLNTHKVPSSILGRNNGKIFHCKEKISFDFFDKYLETLRREFLILQHAYKKKLCSILLGFKTVCCLIFDSLYIFFNAFALTLFRIFLEHIKRVSVVQWSSRALHTRKVLSSILGRNILN